MSGRCCFSHHSATLPQDALVVDGELDDVVLRVSKVLLEASAQNRAECLQDHPEGGEPETDVEPAPSVVLRVLREATLSGGILGDQEPFHLAVPVGEERGHEPDQKRYSTDEREPLRTGHAAGRVNGTN